MAKGTSGRTRKLPLLSLVEPRGRYTPSYISLLKPPMSIPASPVGLSPVSPQRFGNKALDAPHSPFSPDQLRKNGLVFPVQLPRTKTHIRVLSSHFRDFPPRQYTKLPLPVENVITKWAYQTRTGEMNGRPKKQNQDAFIISQLFGAMQGHCLFSVCDGHGVNGHEVSAFLKEQLPRQISSSFIPLDTHNEHRLETAVQDGFRKVVTKLGQSRIDTTFSGSTCVAVVIQGRSLLCANVGDSRAMLISKNKDWQYTLLSTDHKPDMHSEKMRILSKGGQVSPFRGPHGELMGPARVWVQGENVPGLAMSRSIGDAVASSVGVSQEPEIFECCLTPEDKMLILASDGIWEYMTNEEVLKVASGHWANSDLEGCCEHLVQEALKRWRYQDDAVDDITVVVALLEVPETR